MAVWATAVLEVGAGTAEPPIRPDQAGLLAQSRLLDTGSGGGRLSFLEQGVWKEVLAITAADGSWVRPLRVWDALVAEGEAEPANGWYASVSADLGSAALEFDDPTISGALHRTLASYLPLIGRRLIGISTLMADWRRCAGCLTVFEAGSDAEARVLAANDPWRAVFAGRLFRLERAIVRRAPAPAGPGTQRYGGANPWPGGSFG
jgi:hypothetical protein